MLPTVLGSKSVSSRPLFASEQSDQSYFAEDGITPLNPILVPVPPGVPLITTAVCPKNEWLACVTVQYFDMIKTVDDTDEYDDDYDSTSQESTFESPAGPASSFQGGRHGGCCCRRRRRLARRSIVAEMRIQVSPLSLPFSSSHPEICHRLTLSNLHRIMAAGANSQSPKSASTKHYQRSAGGFFHEDHVEHFAAQKPVQLSVLFSSERQRLVCLIPDPRGGFSTLVAFPIGRPSHQQLTIDTRQPKLPPYIPITTPSSSSESSMKYSRPSYLPMSLGDPEFLQLPSNAGLDVRENAVFWLHNITSICLCCISTAATASLRGLASKKGSGTKKHNESSVLLAGCRDGSIVGISIHPLLLSGRLYHPASNHDNYAIEFLSHITTTLEEPTKKNGDQDRDQDQQRRQTTTRRERDVLGKLVAINETGRAAIFQTRIVLSSFTDDGDHTNESDAVGDESTSAFTNDSTDYSASQTEGGSMMIYGESFHVVKQGRQNSFPANTRLSLNKNDLAEALLQHCHFQHFQNDSFHHPCQNGTSNKQFNSYNNNTNSTSVCSTNLLMFVEPLSEYYSEGSLCSAKWITETLLVVLEAPTNSSSSSVANNPSRKSYSHTTRVAHVLGLVPGRRPEPLTELTVAPDNLIRSPHTTFSLLEDTGYDDEYDQESKLHAKSFLLDRNAVTSALEASMGIDYDCCSGCLAISSGQVISDPIAPWDIQGKSKSNQQVCVFVSIWHWRTNTLGFTAATTYVLDSPIHAHRPLSRLLFASERPADNVRQLAHLHFVRRGDWAGRVRKDLYPLGVVSPPRDVWGYRGTDVWEPSPLSLSSSSISFVVACHHSNQMSEIEWQESDLPVAYRHAYGAPVVAAVSYGGLSIAVASPRGLCVLECSPRAKKSLVGRERCYLKCLARQSKSGAMPQMKSFSTRLPPKWHLFGHENEEKAFRVLAMIWWEGHYNSERKHLSDDLLVAAIQLQKQNEISADPAGTCYLACWSQRRLDIAHQRLRPLEERLQASRCEWGVRLPTSFRPQSLRLLAQPAASSCGYAASKKKQRERKALVLLSSFTTDNSFLVYQFQAIASVGRTQSSDSYTEQNPYSVLSRQCSAGTLCTGESTASTPSCFLAGASFQFDLRQKRTRTARDALSGPTSRGVEEGANEMIGTIGVVRSPGGGLSAVVLTSKGPSIVLSILDRDGHGIAKQGQRQPLKSSEISAYWLSDIILAQRSISTSYGENVVIDFYVWTLQLVDGGVLSWFVPCLRFRFFPSASEAEEVPPPNVFSSRIMQGLVCPIGAASTWLHRSPAKTGKDFLVGCVPQSPHGCILSTGQATRKFHRTIAGRFNHFLFASDFMEHSWLHARDVNLSPPAFMSSIKAMIRSKSFLLLSRASETSITSKDNIMLVGGGSSDVGTALLALDSSTHLQGRSKHFQDTAFMALRLLVLRSVEQLSEDIRKGKASLSASVLTEALHVVRSFTADRLQFTSLILEVGRQLEPSSLLHLFPLPVPQGFGGRKPRTSMTVTPPMVMARCKSSIDLRSVAGFFHACVDDGSLLSAASSLPILTAREVSQQRSLQLLEHCLSVFEENSKSEVFFFFDFSRDERATIGDIFRFCIKLEDNALQDVDSQDLLADVDVDLLDDSSSSVEDNRGYDTRRMGYFLACGMLKLPWFGPRKAPSQKSRDTRTTIALPDDDKTATARRPQSGSSPHRGGSCAITVAALLFRITVSSGDGPLSRTFCWKRLAALSFLLLGQGESTSPQLSAPQSTNFAKSVEGFNFGAPPGAQTESAEEGLASLLIQCIAACSMEIGAGSAGRVLDLVLILIGRCQLSSQSGAPLPGLLVIGITAGHISERMAEILDIGDTSTLFTRCYLQAKERADYLYSC